MKTVLAAALLGYLSSLVLSSPAFARRDANDPRRLCREAIQKSKGLGKNEKISRKELDRCVAHGGKL